MKTLDLLAVFGAAAILVSACGSNDPSNLFGSPTDGGGSTTDGGGSHTDGAVGADAGAHFNQDASVMTGSNCASNSPDENGCSCSGTAASRACYTGPAATRNVGACKDGTQACTTSGEFGHYGPCMGGTLPSPEGGHCTDGVDNDCNGKTDCADPACVNDPACVPPPDASPPPPPPPDAGGCVPPQTSIANVRCPNGTTLNPSGLCCPCQASDCGSNNTCCGAAVCANDANCASCAGQALPAVCNGFVDQDCDDFPEDCDQLCCPCKPTSGPTACIACSAGQVPCDPGGGGNTLCALDPTQCVCTDVTSNPVMCGACDYSCNPGQSCVNGTCM